MTTTKTLTEVTYLKGTEKAQQIEWCSTKLWIPKSLIVNQTEDSIEVVEWFYNKEISPKTDWIISKFMSDLRKTGERGLPAQLASAGLVDFILS